MEILTGDGVLTFGVLASNSDISTKTMRRGSNVLSLTSLACCGTHGSLMGC